MSGWEGGGEAAELSNKDEFQLVSYFLRGWRGDVGSGGKGECVAAGVYVQGTLCNSVNNHPLKYEEQVRHIPKVSSILFAQTFPSAETTVLVSKLGVGGGR